MLFNNASWEMLRTFRAKANNYPKHKAIISDSVGRRQVPVRIGEDLPNGQAPRTRPDVRLEQFELYVRVSHPWSLRPAAASCGDVLINDFGLVDRPVRILVILDLGGVRFSNDAAGRR